MSDDSAKPGGVFEDILASQGEALRQLMQPFFPGAATPAPALGDIGEWLEAMQQIQTLWLEFQQTLIAESRNAAAFADTGKWFASLQDFYRRLPFTDAESQERLWQETLGLWESVLGLYGIGPRAGDPADAPAELPRKDRRFADPRWRSQPVFAILHQTYLMLAEQIERSITAVDAIPDEKREQLRFAVRSLIDALSPANYPLTNPVVIERTLETKGDNLVRGMRHLLADLRRGQLSHTDPDAFTVGRDIAVTPGKVVLETPLFELIQYSPSTPEVLATPLVIFPPWINRFYILDLNPKKSFVRWAVEQGLSVFITSWKSADEGMADIAWDDYIAAQIACIDFVRERLGVPAVHTIGYCVAGTTLAATLAILARRGEAGKVASATFFTAQVDFEEAGELKLLCDEGMLTLADRMSEKGYLDGRYMAAAFNALRGQDLIWNYVVNNYLLGEDYPAFDLLFWNGETTNLPARWHHDYTRDLYRDNKLVIPDELSACGTPIDLTRIATPSYIQAGREDHIAPADSVFRLLRHLRGPTRFVLAGSGHIAGVVNPPSAGKYQYWRNDRPCADLAEFVAGAQEHPGSWWPDWLEWLRALDGRTVPGTGKRKPGGRGEAGLPDAPGRYVLMR